MPTRKKKTPTVKFKWANKRPIITADGYTHGTQRTYQAGCKCKECREWKHQDYLERRERTKDRPPLAPDDPRHGTHNAYTNLGCRCEPCKAATSVYNAGARRRKKANDPQRRRAEVLETKLDAAEKLVEKFTEKLAVEERLMARHGQLLDQAWLLLCEVYEDESYAATEAWLDAGDAWAKAYDALTKNPALVRLMASTPIGERPKVEAE